MPYRTLRACVEDLLKTGGMVRIDEPVDTYLEMAAVQRLVYERGGPALYFSQPYSSAAGEKRTPCAFPMVSNLYGSMERLEYIFRDAIAPLQKVMSWGSDPFAELSELSGRLGRFSLRTPFREGLSLLRVLRTSLYAKPKAVRRGPILDCVTTLDQLPQLVSWPLDGGPFVTLPQVYTENPANPGTLGSNLGMYRVQLAGNRYAPNREAGLHYQIHRGIAAHHAEALKRREPLAVNIFIGGAPAMTLAAIMPLPENVSELTVAGMLGRHRVPMITPKKRNANTTELPIYAEADFCICGHLDLERVLPEGPFGDHLGYYSLAHDFPVLHVEKVYHRKDAIWPFTVVGRPPQEDSMFGKFIHELTGPLIPKKISGVHAVRAVDEAGVHPLLLAIGTEHYHPYEKAENRRAAQLHTIAHALLGFGQLSLAKYLLLIAREDDPGLSLEETERFFMHVLSRVDWSRDLHFVTKTNMDTLDYSGTSLHRGSKVAICVAGPPIRMLPHELGECDTEMLNKIRSLGFPEVKLILPGVLLCEGTANQDQFVHAFGPEEAINRFPLIVLVNDVTKIETFRDFLWTTFTKSDPAEDLDGITAFVERKHWGCRGSLVLDARIKSHHAPELVEVPEVRKKAEQLLAKVLG